MAVIAVRRLINCFVSSKLDLIDVFRQGFNSWIQNNQTKLCMQSISLTHYAWNCRWSTVDISADQFWQEANRLTLVNWSQLELQPISYQDQLQPNSVPTTWRTIQSECVEDIFSLISSPLPAAFLSAYADMALSNLLGTVSAHISCHVGVWSPQHLLSAIQFFHFVYSVE